MDLRSIPVEVHAFESHPSHFCFRVDGSCIRVYLDMGVATAEGGGGFLKSPQERDNYQLEYYFHKIL